MGAKSGRGRGKPYTVYRVARADWSSPRARPTRDAGNRYRFDRPSITKLTAAAGALAERWAGVRAIGATRRMRPAQWGYWGAGRAGSVRARRLDSESRLVRATV